MNFTKRSTIKARLTKALKTLCCCCVSEKDSLQDRSQDEQTSSETIANAMQTSENYVSGSVREDQMNPEAETCNGIEEFRSEITANGLIMTSENCTFASVPQDQMNLDVKACYKNEQVNSETTNTENILKNFEEILDGFTNTFAKEDSVQNETITEDEKCAKGLDKFGETITEDELSSCFEEEEINMESTANLSTSGEKKRSYNQVIYSNIDCAADICYNGYVYIYEKCTEELDEFSVEVKVTTDQENCSHGKTANMPIMTRFGVDLKALTTSGEKKRSYNQVIYSNIDCAADICYNRYVYIYEKCTEELDEFSVEVKVTTDQENCSHGKTANMPIMTRFGVDLKALTYWDSSIDETIPDSELSGCFKVKERRKENTENMTYSEELNQTYCCNHEAIAKYETVNTNEQISHETYQDSLQHVMITEDELSTFFEDGTQNDTDCVYVAEDNTSQTYSISDPTMYFSAFSNWYSNSWMNATMQSILNLSITRKFVAKYPEDVFGALSGTPLLANLFCRAMKCPGSFFSPDEMYQVLTEIRDRVALAMPHHNQLTNFLDAMLRQFDPCGINTVCVVYTSVSCEACKETSFDIWDLGPIVCLPHPLPYDSTTSLLNRWVSETYPEHCAVCYSNLKRKYFLNETDMIALYLPRSEIQGGLRHPVIPSATIDIPVKTGTQMYRLSSVICHQTTSSLTDHFYTYLMCGELVYKAEDDQVTYSNIDCAADICYNGYIYIYEKCTEELDEFGVGVKVTTDQEDFNPERTANMPTMTRLGVDLKALTYCDSSIDETIPDSELSGCFKVKERRKENTENMTYSEELNQTYCCNHEAIAKYETVNTNEQISHETYQDSLQHVMITEDELSTFFEDETQNATDYVYVAEDNTSQTYSISDPTMYFSAFSNWYSNSWMNATMQSILNLSITRKFVAKYPEDVFGALSGTPLFANLFCRAMKCPGSFFSPDEMYQVLTEIRDRVALAMPHHNQLTNFLDTILRQFDPCGINAVCVVYTSVSCEACKETSFDIWDLGPIVCLPHPLPYDSTTFLLNRWVSETYPEHCSVCYSNLKRKYFLNETDVIALYLPRSEIQGGLRHPVIPSATIDIPVKTGTQMYRLSSVICHQTTSSLTDHFYTYLMCGELVYKAEDDQVTYSNIDCAADICYNGYIYIYEKCTEELDEFSVGVKVNPDQEHLISESTANMTSSREPNQTYCCNHKASAKDETETKEKEISHETFQEPLQHVVITEDELQNDTDYCYGSEINRSQISSHLDPTIEFCKFSNSFNNSWMNATMQSILNLSIARIFVDKYPENVFGALSGTPLCASLVLTAMHHPGTYFTPEQIYQVLIEVSESVPSLGWAQQNLTAAFLSSFLSWLNPCGINTVCMLNNIITCEQCRVATPVLAELGPVVYLSDAKPNDTTASLLQRFVLEDCYEKECNICRSNIKRYIFFNHTDVLTLHLDRSTSEGDLGSPVIPSATIEIPLQNGAQMYCLSSVICRQTLRTESDHFYAYLKSGQLVFLADDDQVTISHGESAKDLYQNGFMYIYEKYSEGTN